MKYIMIAGILAMSLFHYQNASAKKLPGDFGDLACEACPYPWGEEVPFPWKSINGAWKATSDEGTTYFNFEVQHETTHEKSLVVTEIDPFEGSILASGLGYEDDRIVRAAMLSKVAHKPSSYQLIVRGYKDIKGKKTIQKTIQAGVAMIMTIQTVDKNNKTWSSDYQLEKVSDQTICMDCY